ncbi:MAG: ExbD/TolR family protein [Nitrospinales bacterium]
MRFRNEEEEDFSLDMTPMIDVVFLLLIFFMVSTAFVDFSRRMDIALPTSKSSTEEEVAKPLLIEMTTDKRIFLNGKEVVLKQLELKLKRSLKTKQPSATIKADKALPYGNVIKVMGILQGTGIKDISVAVK